MEEEISEPLDEKDEHWLVDFFAIAELEPCESNLCGNYY